MKRFAVAIAIYAGAIMAGAIMAGLASTPFLRAGDFSIQFQMVITGVLSGFYILTFTPVVVLTEIMARNIRTHRAIPVVAIPLFGLTFPVVGFVLFSDNWWPEEPIDMRMKHLLAACVLALLSIGTGVLFTVVRNRTVANKN